MSGNCIFCRIARGEIPSTKVAESETMFAFRDLNPQAPTHVLVIPRAHVASLAAANDPKMLGDLLSFAASVARSEGLEKGYRVVANTGPDGGQTVDHLHLHVLGGRHMTWPPG
ncbi:MAG TPA: histidine triad nucleotide-binding protein [Gemmatimonadaceae bacterium]|nr:histidine triad nucleotide-binding protein [Gemmatimonadaceae bacterium]